MVNLNDVSVINAIIQRTGQKWRPCKRKQYNIYAFRMPEGYIFANRLEQPDSFEAIKKYTGKYIISEEDCKSNLGLMNILSQYGCYKTDGKRITLCGTAGELWSVTEEKLKSAYRLPTGEPITKIPDDWFMILRAAEATPQAVGICIPKDLVGVYQTSWATLYVNNPKSNGHYKGDILVAPLVNGQPNLAKCSPTNNAVFATTYDTRIGGWGNTGLIYSAEHKPFSIEKCRKIYSVEKRKNSTKLLEAKKLIYSIISEVSRRAQVPCKKQEMLPVAGVKDYFGLWCIPVGIPEDESFESTYYGLEYQDGEFTFYNRFIESGSTNNKKDSRSFLPKDKENVISYISKLIKKIKKTI